MLPTLLVLCCKFPGRSPALSQPDQSQRGGSLGSQLLVSFYEVTDQSPRKESSLASSLPVRKELKKRCDTSSREDRGRPQERMSQHRAANLGDPEIKAVEDK